MKKDPNAAAEADMEAAIMAQLDLDMEDLMKGGITNMIIVEFYNSNVIFPCLHSKVRTKNLVNDIFQEVKRKSHHQLPRNQIQLRTKQKRKKRKRRKRSQKQDRKLTTRMKE